MHYSSAYREEKDILELGELLGLKERRHKHQIQLLLAQAALLCNDWFTANKLCQELANVR